VRDAEVVTAALRGALAGITGSLTSPQTLLLGRDDTSGRLRLVTRTAPLPTAHRREIADRISVDGPGRPWQGRRFSTGWGTRGELEYHPVRPDLVVEFIADTSIDAGRCRHPVRYLRLRDDLTPDQAQLFAG
jgi:hypothetical protein